MCPGPSFIAKYNCGRSENHLLIFDSMLFQREKEFEKFQKPFKSLGSALPADVTKILLPHIQGYKIAFEDGTLF